MDELDRAHVEAARRLGGQQHLGRRDSSRANTIFCALPPDRLPACVSTEGVRTSKSAIRLPLFCRIALLIEPAAVREGFIADPLQDEILRDGEVTQHAHAVAVRRDVSESDAAELPCRRAKPCGRRCESPRRSRAEARDDLFQFRLAVAGHAGHAHDLARGTSRLTSRKAGRSRSLSALRCLMLRQRLSWVAGTLRSTTSTTSRPTIMHARACLSVSASRPCRPRFRRASPLPCRMRPAPRRACGR